MSLFHIFFPKRIPSASIAKERLQLVLAHERIGRDGPDFLPALQKDLLAVVSKYFEAKDDMIQVKLGKTGNASILEINVELAGRTEAGRLRAGAPA
jgi:cell division topological specificity factor